MKRLTKIATAAVLTLALTITPVVYNYAENVDTDKTAETTQENIEATDAVAASEEGVAEILEKQTVFEEPVLDDEVVYVFADSKGDVKKLTDSIWIEEGTEEVNEKEAYDLPVGVDIKYYMDGKEVSAEEIKNLTGHLKISVNYTDLKSSTELINGQKETIYVPFAALLVSVLDSDNCSNVTVSRGRVIYDGNRYAVTGLAFPGLNEDLGTKLCDELKEADDKFGNGDSVTIEADVDKCDFPGIYIVVTNSVFNDLKINDSGKLDELKEDLNSVNDAMDKLMDGSSKIYDGLGTLLDGAKKLDSGVGQLSNGLDTLSSNSAALNKGATDVFNALLATASSQLKANGLTNENLTIANYANVINACIDGLNGTDTTGAARTQVEAAVRANTDKVKAAVTTAVRDGVKAQVSAEVRKTVEAQVSAGVAAQVAAANGVTEEEALALPGVADQITQMTDAKMAEDSIKQTIEATTDAQMASDSVKAMIESKTEEQIQALIAQNMNSSEVQSKISAGNAQIAAGVETLKGLLNQLNSYKSFYDGLNAYTGGVDKCANGANTLKNSMPDVISGITKLKDSEGLLNEGIVRFNDEGVGKLNDIMNNNIEGLSERFDAISRVSASYSAYTDGENTEKSSVKFIYKISTDK